MEMAEILKEMEANLDNQKAVLKLHESKVEILQDAFNKAQKELNDELARLTTVKDDVFATEQAIDMLKMGSFAQKKAEETTDVKAEVKEEEKAAKPEMIAAEPKKSTTRKQVKQLEWKHKGAYVLQLNKYGNILDRWSSQKAAARSMRWDQSSVSKFMKLDKEVQLKKKGFYLAWEY